MILDNETKKKFGYYPDDTGKFSKNIIICKCDICNNIFEKEYIKISMARKNSHSVIDVCENIECIKRKRETTMLKKFGVSNAGQSSILREKVKNTCIKKYGVSNPLSSPDIIEKIKQTNIEKHGVQNPFQSEKIKEKIKQTNLQKYGVEYNSQSPEYKEKVKQTNITRYGKPSYSQTDEYRQKTKKTNIEKYKSEWYLGSDDSKEKTKQFFIKNHGVSCYSKTIDSKIKRREWQYKQMCEKIFGGNRLGELYEPLFSIDDYKGVGKKYKFKCKKCNHVFFDDIDDGRFPSCNFCNPPLSGKSQYELDLSKFLSSIGINNVMENMKLQAADDKLEIDIYLPDYQLGIEVNGNYWHSEIGGKKGINYHIRKTEECENRGIRLIHIFEDEWIYKQEIIRSRLRNILNTSPQKRYARKCQIQLISSTTANDFLNRNHLQGSTKSSIKIGLYFGDELVSVMTLGKFRFSGSNDENTYEIIRYASKINLSVIGGFDKLLQYFIRTYNPQKIISYADRRWSTKSDNVYTKNKFRLIKSTPPNYWYVHRKNYLCRIYRFIFRKSELSKKLGMFDPNLTEWENMQINGYDRIWDCGHLKYEWCT